MLNIETWTHYRNFLVWDRYQIETYSNVGFTDRLNIETLKSVVKCNQKPLIIMVWNDGL